ncbi:hypothetical protein, partial [Peribacillus butanolivorans]
GFKNSNVDWNVGHSLSAGGGKPYALIGHVRFDKGEATRVVSLLFFLSDKVVHVITIFIKVPTDYRFYFFFSTILLSNCKR